MNIFAAKDTVIEEHNALGESYTLGHNKFSTWTEAEYESMLTPRSRTPTTDVMPPRHVSNQTWPTGAIDWSATACMNPVQDQGQCGSCWAFASVASMENSNCIAKGMTGLEKFSEQQLVDCCGSLYGCAGCNGGWMYGAFRYYMNGNNAMSEASYPYMAVDQPCNYDAANTTGVNNTNWAWSACYPTQTGCNGDTAPIDPATGVATIPSVDQIKASLNDWGALTIAIQANGIKFQLYTGGVFANTGCWRGNLDHAVVIVGWGTDATAGPYWKVRNSWGSGWGEAGYIRFGIEGTTTDQVPGICGCQMEPEWPWANNA